jgi:hypothetical protein
LPVPSNKGYLGNVLSPDLHLMVPYWRSILEKNLAFLS